MAILNVHYLISKSSLPYRAKPWMAYSYLLFFIAILVFYIAEVISVLLGHPILDAKKVSQRALFAQCRGFGDYSLIH